MNDPNYPEPMAAAKRKAIWLSWVPFLVMAAGWRLWSGVVDPVPVLTVYGVAIGALVLWGTVRRSRPAARTPAERRAATEARWAQGAEAARRERAEQAAEYERAAEQRRREAAERREAEAAGR